MTQQLHSWAYISEKWKLRFTQKLMNIHRSFMCKSPRLEKPRCPSTDEWSSNYIHTTEYYLAKKRCQQLGWVRGIMLSEESPKSYIPRDCNHKHPWNDNGSVRTGGKGGRGLTVAIKGEHMGSLWWWNSPVSWLWWWLHELKCMIKMYITTHTQHTYNWVHVKLVKSE